MKDDKILVEIAAYRDPELLNTVNSALIQADNPDRVIFSICYQSDNVEDYEKLKRIKNCRIKWLKESEAKGSCYARYLCQQMLEDEKYVFQIDSHMRFVKHWDTKLIEELLSLNDDKAIISFYPPDCNGEMMDYPLDDPVFDNPAPGGLMYANRFQDSTTPFISVLCEALVDDYNKNHLRTTLISAGNFFTFSDAHREVQHDPNMYFYGDELYMSIKLFTYGWNVYNSTKSYIYHQYCRPNHKFPSVNNAMDIEKNKLIDIIKNKNNKEYLKEHDMGLVRTIDEYEKFSGIDFENRIIYLTASTGELENEKYFNKISHMNKKLLERREYLNRKEKIEVLIVDLFGNYKECLNSCLNNSINKENISFIIGSINESPSIEELSNMQIKKYITFDKNSHYSEILNTISKELGNSYVCVVDSSVRFINGWDDYSLYNLKLCGTKSVLTNWLYKIDKNDIDNSVAYTNIVMEVTEYKSYLPAIVYNSSINLSDIKTPYETQILFDGFIFCHSSILKEIEIDPNLRYDEQNIVYSLRLWTNGINIYIPKESFFVRVEDSNVLNTIPENFNIVYTLFRIRNRYSCVFESGYQYDIGEVRPIWAWYKQTPIDYDNDKEEINNN